MKIEITRTEATTGGPKRTKREEFVPVFDENTILVEPDMAGDGSESEGWTLSWGAPLWPTQLEAMRQFTGAAQDLDSQLKGEQSGGDDDKGGMYAAFFNHRLIKVGVEHQSDDRYVAGRDEDDEGDLNLTNWDHKIKMLQDPQMGPLPIGGTVISPTIAYLDGHYMGEFEKDEETGLVVPVAQRPIRARVIWTDGAMKDWQLFGKRLEEDHSDKWPAEHWFIAILGEGDDHDATLRLYNQIAAKRPGKVHVYSFDRVASGAEIAEDMAVAVLGRKAAA